DTRLDSRGDGRWQKSEKAPTLRPTGPPDVNVALLSRLGITDPEDLFERRVHLRTGTPHDTRNPAVITELTDKVRALLLRIGIEQVDDMDPPRTCGMPQELTPGAHSTAALFLAGPDEQPETDDHEPGSI